MGEENRANVINVLLILTLFLIILLGYIQNVTTEDQMMEEDDQLPVQLEILTKQNPTLADQERYFLDVSGQVFSCLSLNKLPFLLNWIL